MRFFLVSFFVLFFLSCKRQSQVFVRGAEKAIFSRKVWGIGVDRKVNFLFSHATYAFSRVIQALFSSDLRTSSIIVRPFAKKKGGKKEKQQCPTQSLLFTNGSGTCTHLPEPVDSQTVLNTPLNMALNP